MGWLEMYARALGSPVDVTAAERTAILDLAREVAHRTERVMAPLSTYVAGAYVARRLSEGASPEEALREAVRVAEEHLPPRGS